MGVRGGVSSKFGLRFTGVTIPAGATIDVAYPSVYSSVARSSVDYIDFWGDDQNNPSTYSTEADWDGRTKTAAVVTWTIPAFAADTWYNGPSIVSIIAGLLASYTLSNSSIGVLSADNASAAYHSMRTYDNATTQAAKLHIEYTAGGVALPRGDYGGMF